MNNLLKQPQFIRSGRHNEGNGLSDGGIAHNDHTDIDDVKNGENDVRKNRNIQPATDSRCKRVWTG